MKFATLRGSDDVAPCDEDAASGAGILGRGGADVSSMTRGVEIFGAAYDHIRILDLWEWGWIEPLAGGIFGGRSGRRDDAKESLAAAEVRLGAGLRGSQSRVVFSAVHSLLSFHATQHMATLASLLRPVGAHQIHNSRKRFNVKRLGLTS